MKALNKIFQILAIVFGVGSLVLFFTPFAEIVTNGNTVKFVAAQLGFGGGTHDLARSAHILFTFWLTVIGAVMGIFAYKSKSFRYGSSALALISAIYLWVIALSDAVKFVDCRPLQNVSAVNYTVFGLILAIVATLFAIFAIAYLFMDDYLEAKNSKDKKTILQKVVLFFRDNKSEVKKIVWPSLHDVVKNTVTVLVMCLVIGALIWVIDLGLGQLLNLILGA